MNLLCKKPTKMSFLEFSGIKPRIAYLANNLGAKALELTRDDQLLRFQMRNGKKAIFSKSKEGEILALGEAQKMLDILKSADDKRTDKQKLMDRDGCSCVYCGIELTLRTATVEHVIPQSHGGTNELYNLALSCSDCNERVGNLPPAQKLIVAREHLLMAI